jgi:hypothetical protein
MRTKEGMKMLKHEQEGPAVYPLAAQGVYPSMLGEGLLMGLPAVLVRLAGCSVGCPGCDTDYRVTERATAAEIARRAAGVMIAWPAPRGAKTRPPPSRKPLPPR